MSKHIKRSLEMLNQDINGLILEWLSVETEKDSTVQYKHNAKPLTHLEHAIYDSKMQNKHDKIQLLVHILKDQHLAIKDKYIPLMFYPENRQLMSEFIQEYQLEWYNEGGNLFMGCHNIADGVYRFTIKPSRCLMSYTRKIVGIFISGDFCQWKKSYQLICIKDDLYTITIKNIPRESGYKYFLIDDLGMKYWFNDPGSKMSEDRLNNKIGSDIEASLKIYNKYMAGNYFIKNEGTIDCNFMFDTTNIPMLDHVYYKMSVEIYGNSKSYTYKNCKNLTNIFGNIYVSNVQIPLILPNCSVFQYYMFKYVSSVSSSFYPYNSHYYFLDKNHRFVTDKLNDKTVINNIIRI
jgi:hypothetical protein